MVELADMSRERLIAIIERLLAERSTGPFITGMSSARDRNGLPDHLLLCAATGADVVASYRRFDGTGAEHVVSDDDQFRDAFARARGRINRDIDLGYEGNSAKPHGARLFISPAKLTEEEFERRLSQGPEIVWREGDNWRICEWATGQRALELLSQGWEEFDDWDDDERRFPGTYA